MLVRMGNHVLKAEDTGSFLSKTFANCLVQIKRNFDRYIVRSVHFITRLTYGVGIRGFLKRYALYKSTFYLFTYLLWAFSLL